MCVLCETMLPEVLCMISHVIPGNNVTVDNQHFPEIHIFSAWTLYSLYRPTRGILCAPVLVKLILNQTNLGTVASSTVHLCLWQ